jgi:hypothetical protein
MHNLIIGNESRQQLYAMCTRGRLSNYIYLQPAGDGDLPRQNRAIDIFHFPGFGRRAQPPSAALSLAPPDNRARDSSHLLCA